MLSCLLLFQVFPWTPQSCCTSPVRVFSWQSIPVLSLESGLWNLSLSIQAPFTAANVHTSISGWVVLSALTSVLNFLCFTFHAPIAALPSEVPKVPPSSRVREFPSVRQISSYTPPFLRNKSCPNPFVSIVFLISFSQSLYVEITCLFWSLRSSVSIQ